MKRFRQNRLDNYFTIKHKKIVRQKQEQPQIYLKCSQEDRRKCKIETCFFHQILCNRIAKKQLYFYYYKNRLNRLVASNQVVYEINQQSQVMKLCVSYQLFRRQFLLLLLMIERMKRRSKINYFPKPLIWHIIKTVYRNSLKLVE